jgi:hypothetical protein
MQRAFRLALGAGVVVALFLVATMSVAATDAEDVNQAQGHFVRWDMVNVQGPPVGVVVPGGTDLSRDAAAGDTVSLTGSGQARPGPRDATGGGTFVHKHADGTVFAEGVYYVTGFVSWEPLGGSLAATGLIDGVGPIDQTSSGELTMRVHLVPSSGGAGFDGSPTIHCHLPGATRDIPEGVSLAVASFHFEPVAGQGFTLFHILH